MPAGGEPRRLLHWFRKGLRLHDNAALQRALRDIAAGGEQVGGVARAPSPLEVFGVFVLDPHFALHSADRIGERRWRFLEESLRDLDEQLRALGLRLHVARGQPLDTLAELIDAWRIDTLSFEDDVEPYARRRDADVQRMCAARGVRVLVGTGHTLYDMQRLREDVFDGKPVAAYRSFVARVQEQLGEPPRPVDDTVTLDLLRHAARCMRTRGASAPSTAHARASGDEQVRGRAAATAAAAAAAGASDDDADADHDVFAGDSALYRRHGGFRVFTLEEIGQPEPNPPSPFRGGERVALARMRSALADEQWVRAFAKPETAPTALDKPSTTVLSPHLKFGTLSARTFYHALRDIERRAGAARKSGASAGAAPSAKRGASGSAKHTLPPVSLVGQLLWREFYTYNGLVTPNYDTQVGNPLCKTVDWDTRPELLRAWAEARTGYPFIDAIMTQLRTDGWIHHLARHAVACFLTRGDLYISWEEGARVFERLLLDADWCLNIGNWMWLSGASSFFTAYFRVYSPVAFGKHTDPEGAYIRRHLPVLARMPAAYIYEPWTAPADVQARAGCRVGVDYPERVVVHEAVVKDNLARLRRALYPST